MAAWYLVLSCLFNRYHSRTDGGWEHPADGGTEGDDNHDKHSEFTGIVLKFIMDGAPDEVNLRCVRANQARSGASFYFRLGIGQPD